MTKILKMFRYGEKGFTLIELLVVIAILGAIAAVVVLNVGKFMGRGCDEAAATELHNVQTAAIACLVEGETPPASITAGTDGGAPINQYFVGVVHGGYTLDQSTGEVLTQTYAPCK